MALIKLEGNWGVPGFGGWLRVWVALIKSRGLGASSGSGWLKGFRARVLGFGGGFSSGRGRGFGVN